MHFLCVLAQENLKEDLFSVSLESDLFNASLNISTLYIIYLNVKFILSNKRDSSLSI